MSGADQPKRTVKVNFPVLHTGLRAKKGDELPDQPGSMTPSIGGHRSRVRASLQWLKYPATGYCVC